MSITSPVQACFTGKIQIIFVISLTDHLHTSGQRYLAVLHMRMGLTMAYILLRCDLHSDSGTRSTGVSSSSHLAQSPASGKMTSTESGKCSHKRPRMHTNPDHGRFVCDQVFEEPHNVSGLNYSQSPVDEQDLSLGQDPLAAHNIDH